MAALSSSRRYRERSGEQHEAPAAANVRVYEGALTCRNAAGDAVPGSVSTTLKACGVATAEANNTGGAAGAVSVKYKRGTFCFDNDAADPITKADVENTAYITDDQTVCRTNGGATKSPAGRIVDVDSSGVWVRIGL